MGATIDSSHIPRFPLVFPWRLFCHDVHVHCRPAAGETQVFHVLVCLGAATVVPIEIHQRLVLQILQSAHGRLLAHMFLMLKST